MTRRIARTDDTHLEIRAACRAAGWHVKDTHRLGCGIPDLAVSKNGLRAWVECKSKGGELTDNEQHAIDVWLPGLVIVAYSGRNAVDQLAHLERSARK